MTRIIRAAVVSTVPWLIVVPTVVFATQNLNLELQSNCQTSEELYAILSKRLLLPALQTLVRGSSKPPPGGTSTLGRLFSQQASTISSEESNFPFEVFSISSGDNRRSLAATRENTTATDSPMLRGGGWDEEEDNAITNPPILAAFDCPVFSQCPCSGCPGHWCLVFCGFAGGQRKLMLGPPEPRHIDVDAIQEETLPSDHRLLRENVFTRRSSVSNNKSAKPQRPVYCDLIQRALLDMKDTCLQGATILRCSVA